MTRLPRYTFFPESESTIARPPGKPLAHSSTLKPAGTLSLLTAISFGGVSVNLGGCPFSGELAIEAGLPSPPGGGFGLSCPCAEIANAAAMARATSFFMVFYPPREALLELKACLDSTADVAPR